MMLLDDNLSLNRLTSTEEFHLPEGALTLITEETKKRFIQVVLRSNNEHFILV